MEARSAALEEAALRRAPACRVRSGRNHQRPPSRPGKCCFVCFLHPVFLHHSIVMPVSRSSSMKSRSNSHSWLDSFQGPSIFLGGRWWGGGLGTGAGSSGGCAKLACNGRGRGGCGED